MRKQLLTAGAALAMIAPTFANALTGEAVPRDYNAENVSPDQPFGELDISAAGDSAATLREFLSGLTGEDLIELIQRCLVIAPVAMLPAVSYAGIPAEAAADMADGEANDAPDSDRELFGGVSAFDEPTTSFCVYMQRVVFGDESFDEGYLDAVLDARTPD
jgi:hypothetical protein